MRKLHITPQSGDAWRIGKMNRLAGAYIRLREGHKRFDRGQTMAEYALILAAVAIGVFVAYQSMGNEINQMVTWQTIDNDLTSSLGG